MKKILYLIAGGGFQWESLTLAKQIKNQINLVYLAPAGITRSPITASADGKIYFSLPDITTRSSRRFDITLINIVKSVFIIWGIVAQESPDAAIGLGASMSIPLAIVCRIKKIPFIFIESITRTDTLSVTGRLLLSLRLVNHFFVQWPELQDKKIKLLYKGTVL